MADYSPGDWYGLVSPAGAALLPPEVPTETVTRIWTDLRAGKGLAAILDGLVGSFGTSLSGLPQFAALVPDGAAGVRVAMRGSVEARLRRSSDEAVVVSGEGVTTWSERAVTAVATAEVLLLEPSSTGAMLPVIDGIVRACALSFDGLDGATQPEPAPLQPRAERPGPAGTAGVVAAKAVGSADGPVAPVGFPDSATELPHSGVELTASDEASGPGAAPSEPADAAEPAPLAASSTNPEPSFPPPAPVEAPAPVDQPASGEQPTPSIVPAASTVPIAGEEPSEPLPTAEPSADRQQEPLAPTRDADTLLGGEEPNEYDRLLFGETVLSSVEAAAVREEADGATAASWPGSDQQPKPADAPLASAVPLPPPTAGSMISGIPGFGVPPAPAALGDHDGETVSVDQLRALLAGREESPAAPSSQLGAPAARPARLLIPGQSPITLDRGAIVGTRPKLSRVQAGFAPHLVAVSSPSGEISRSHVELRVEGATVLAVDLNSTNGTMLLRRGLDPMRLQPLEPNILVAGDRVDLGDGVVLDFEGLA